MNKRPLLYVLAGFVLGEVWIWQFQGTATLAALCLTAIICMIIGWGKKSGLFILLSIGLIAGGCRTYDWNGDKDKLSKRMNGKEYMIRGQIEETEQNEFSYSIIIDNLVIDHNPLDGMLLVYLNQMPQCYIGSTILLKGRIESFDLPTNPGQFHLRNYRESKGILGHVKNPEVVEIRMGSFLIKDAIYHIRQNAIEYMKNQMKNEYSATGIAMAFGNKTYLEDNQKNLYEFGGISHVLAVSGLHMSLLGAAVYKMLRKAGVGYSISVCASIPCIVVYAVMTGMSSSCMRAAIMLCIYLLAEWKGYYYDLPSALSFAGVWLLFENPARLFDSGFLLSFGAMIAVGVICPWLFRIFQYSTRKNKVRDGFLSGSIITIFTLPLSLYFFYGFSIAGLLLNLIVIPLMTFLVPLLFFGGMGWCAFVPGMISTFCFRAAEWMLALYEWLCKFAGKVDFSYIQAGHRGVGFCVMYYTVILVMIGFLWLIFRKKKKFSFLAGLMCITLIVLFVFLTGRRDEYLTMLDVGQGDGILYHTKYGEVCMFDGGSTSEKNVGNYVIRPALEYYGIEQIDYWFLSHFDEDHISGAKELLENGYDVKRMILPARKEKSETQIELEALAEKNNTRIYYMKQGDGISLKNSRLSCLYPKNKSTGDENQNSMVLLLDTENQQILLTGDVEKSGEDNMVKFLKKYSFAESKEQILKVAHHGSANGTREELLKVFHPDTAFISCAVKNRYGHPAKETVNRLKDAGTEVYYTMQSGAIEIRLGKETSYLGYGMVKSLEER